MGSKRDSDRSSRRSGDQIQVGNIQHSSAVAIGTGATVVLEQRLTQPSPFLSPEDFFHHWMNPTHLFNHSWDLVGRRDYLELLQTFLISEKENVAILPGRGGIGKTKLLQAFCQGLSKNKQSFRTLLLREEVPISSDLADIFPGGPTLIIIDDAHRREDLPLLLSSIQRRSSSTKLLLSTRPHGTQHILAALTRSGVDPREILRLPELTELPREEMRQLAEQALGTTARRQVDQLAQTAWDSPLVVTVGGRLLAEHALHPELLERVEDFRTVVLNRYLDEMIGAIALHGDEPTYRAILTLIAGLGPLQFGAPGLNEAVAQFLQLDLAVYLQALDGLERSGILLRRGSTLRITPDVVSDHLLYNACLTSQGERTGYAERLFHSFQQICPVQVLRNLAELDWRVRGAGENVDVLADIWQMICLEFEDATREGRASLINLVGEVAYYQPERTLEIVKLAMANRTDPKADTLAEREPSSDTNILHLLPPLLRDVAYTMSYLPICCDLLWELGRNDRRALNSNPNHPIRVLSDLASYGPDKPVVFNQTVLDRVASWLTVPRVQDTIHSPLDILDVLLAKVGSSAVADGRRLLYRSFAVESRVVQSIHSRGLALLSSCLASDDPRDVMRAIGSLETALMEPVSLFNRPMSEDERAQWRPEQQRELDLLDSQLRQSSDPVMHVRIGQAILWTACNSPDPTLQQRARQTLAAIPDTADFRVTRLLAGGVRLGLLEEGETVGSNGHANLERFQQREKAYRRRVATEILADYPDPATATAALRSSIQRIRIAGLTVNPMAVSELLDEIAHQSPHFGVEMAGGILESLDTELLGYLHLLLYRSRSSDSNITLSILRRAMQSGSALARQSIARLFSIQEWSDYLTDPEIEVIRELLSDEDVAVRRTAIFSLSTLTHLRQKLALELVMDVKIGTDPSICGDICGLFIADQFLSTDSLRILFTKESWWQGDADRGEP